MFAPNVNREVMGYGDRFQGAGCFPNTQEVGEDRAEAKPEGRI